MKYKNNKTYFNNNFNYRFKTKISFMIKTNKFYYSKMSYLKNMNSYKVNSNSHKKLK